MSRPRLRKLRYYGRSALSLAAALEPRSLVQLPLWKGPRELAFRSGFRFEVNGLLDVLVLKETLCDDVYRLSRLPPSTRLIVDVGAGFGDVAVHAASSFPRASILACEPNPEAFGALERNVRANRLANVDARCVAVGTRAAYELARPRWSAEASAHVDRGTRFHAAGIRLDELIGTREVELVKIDCEGAELDVLDSVGDAIAQVKRVAVEYHDHLVEAAGDRVEEFLRAQGFLVARAADAYDPRIGYVYGAAPRNGGDSQYVERHPQ
jgi:FkbM family methyltransferase